MIKSVKSKFIIITILFVVISIGIPTFFLLVQFKRNFQQRSLMMLNATLEVVHKGLMYEMEHGDKKEIQKIVTQVADNDNIAHIRIFDQTGVIKYASKIDEIGSNLQKYDPHHLNDIQTRKTSISVVDERKAYSATKPIVNEKSCQKCHEKKPKHCLFRC